MLFGNQKQVTHGGRLKGMFVCSVRFIIEGQGAFIKAGAFIMAFTVCKLIH